ncbi:hypothetical protein [Puia sp.]|jgi:hypothetical protein|uniref:hypothetical protein n=1 Tax=Puia sp. TaxID=2045100 RepID=UPI002F422DDD
MLKPITIEWRKLTRKLLVSAIMVTVVGLAFASKGGGGDKKSNTTTTLKTNFTPIRTTTGFTLKAGPSFSGSVLLSTEKKANYVSFNTLITYEKGNSMYIMPYRYKINNSLFLQHNTGNSSLQLLDLHINMSSHK